MLASFENPTPNEEEEIAIIDKFIKKYSHTYAFDSDEFMKIMILNIDCRVLNITSKQVGTLNYLFVNLFTESCCDTEEI